ncbi:hypothetical protein VINI7043_01600 [Vibrio nigripulchritudo ATCC 27043]|uniref:Uncharacterized protein n=2 Tax=Vibrio nigripulchritudo TaxID=28173 RepID=U4KCE6_9VIBR|nr:hypothetical protein [Vibrio nigripulchritudo]CCN33744.1 hypothetical protein VIBNIAM115_1260070 [Vibrio nigripulchritudo AM115]CCN41946.1 hypothetical protein VIBNIFTn2_210199 [Vibrio nigripulchritudo FTn2]CCN71770.1 hypothetical protein VIBNISFn118_440028 [Vibrio nigripulchritudo SFn118]CCN81279.1 hypothetical protein VIBNIBLFn1_200044 [Vibrio nigripulchritudo BLFn1]CCN86602.1 hypothetical protein VIBNISFn27_110044 [Vibrio nigripulchritudo SFn27]CCO43016.1 hypothetical protein VIBNISFn13
MAKRSKLPDPIKNLTLEDLIKHNGGDLLVASLRDRKKDLSDEEFKEYIKKFRGSRKRS